LLATFALVTRTWKILFPEVPYHHPQQGDDAMSNDPTYFARGEAGETRSEPQPPPPKLSEVKPTAAEQATAREFTERIERVRTGGAA
jgi:hypothetical protein